MGWPRPGQPAWSIAGVTLHIHRSWFFIVLLITWTLARGHFPSASPGLPAFAYWAMGVVAALSLFLCVLLHELGHSVVARHHGIPIDGVTLFFFGGVAQMGHEPRRPAVELQVALAGPLKVPGRTSSRTSIAEGSKSGLSSGLVSEECSPF